MESLATVALSALLMTPMVGLLKASHRNWESSNGEAACVHRVDGVLRHVASKAHQCVAAVAISSPNEALGSVSLVAPGDSSVFEQRIIRWSLNGSGELWFETSEEASLLATNIDSFRVEGVGSDGVSAATVVSDIASLRCTASSTMIGGRRGYIMTRHIRLRSVPKLAPKASTDVGVAPRSLGND